LYSHYKFLEFKAFKNAEKSFGGKAIMLVPESITAIFEFSIWSGEKSAMVRL